MAKESSKDLVKERAAFLEDLQSKVDEAFDNRIKVNLIRDRQETEEDLNRARADYSQIKQLLDIGVKPEDISVNLVGLPTPPNQTYVENSHDYKDLLMMAINKVWQTGRLTEEQKNHIVAQNLEHEFAHHVPALTQEGLKVLYSVSFMEDKETRAPLFRPSIILHGSTDLNIYQQIVSGPSQHSHTDEAMIGRT